ncbi:outer membrane protein [Bartonella machadoae]|uniref:outer membrane protein n=1 Tax=Bartonella machadoae TaxID=2893471 RepID=UPI001F4CB68F|nr:outer membrane protein [Bartonella machadoae]UNE54794.1 porin family protein [Bartonella machadoae]
MTTKYFITTFLFSLTLISVVQASDVIIPEQPVPVVAVPAFSWTGLYLGGQIGNFSSKTSASYLRGDNSGKWISFNKEFLPKLSGLVGGIYAGSNVGIDNGFIVGIDTDVIWTGKKNTKDISPQNIHSPQENLDRAALEKRSRSTTHQHDPNAAGTKAVQYILKQKWTGATRVRVGFPVDHMMPYFAGRIAYAQLQNVFAKAADTTNKAMNLSDFLHDEKKTMIGYTFGGGIDFAMTDNVIMRAEYRYSDYGRKKFANEKIEIGYKTNDFRVGVAYKF